MSKHLNKLKQLFVANAMKKYPNYPMDYIAVPEYVENTANGLTKCIIKFIELSGYRACRVSSAGRYIDESKIVSDVLGNQRKIGTGTWVKSQTTKGYADIDATIKGMSVKIEVKMKDKQSESQKKFAQSEIDAGGQYWLCHNFDEFYEKYLQFINN